MTEPPYEFLERESPEEGGVRTKWPPGLNRAPRSGCEQDARFLTDIKEQPLKCEKTVKRMPCAFCNSRLLIEERGIVLADSRLTTEVGETVAYSCDMCLENLKHTTPSSETSENNFEDEDRPNSLFEKIKAKI